MPELRPTKLLHSRAESFERSLNLKQLQISRILNITQAINDNLSEDGLYEMLKSFLTWELGVSKMALFTSVDDVWTLVSSQAAPSTITDPKYIEALCSYERTSNLKDQLLGELGFTLIIPVKHKSQGIAYLLIGDIKLDENEEQYNVIQMITTIANIIAVAIENKKLFKRQLEQQGLKKEMQLGRDIQQMLVPQQLPSNDKISFDCIYPPKLSIGGDYYDCIEFSPNKLAFCIGDISGKGIGAALLMANFQANFQSLIRQRVPLKEFIQALNSSVNQITKGDKFITFFIAEIDLEKKELRYINAGHNPPILRSGSALKLLDSGCTILGSFDELPEINIGIEQIEEGDVIVSFTDGLVEIKNDKDIFLSEEMLSEYIQSIDLLNPKQINTSIKTFVDDFKESESYPDDFTLLTCMIKNHS